MVLLYTAKRQKEMQNNCHMSTEMQIGAKKMPNDSKENCHRDQKQLQRDSAWPQMMQDAPKETQ